VDILNDLASAHPKLVPRHAIFLADNPSQLRQDVTYIIRIGCVLAPQHVTTLDQFIPRPYQKPHIR
jgi:hypothetical protein